MIGHEMFGSGPRGVIVLNDWLCDTSTWDEARTYLDGSRLTWAFADLRGYGRSRGLSGAFTLEEAAGDVVALADALSWRSFAIVGHSMSGLIALHLAQHHSDRLERAVAITPPPPAGFGYDDATVEAVRAVGMGNDERRESALRRMLGDRLSDGWLRFKIRRWRERSEPEAVAAYVEMFGRRPDPKRSRRPGIGARTKLASLKEGRPWQWDLRTQCFKRGEAKNLAIGARWKNAKSPSTGPAA